MRLGLATRRRRDDGAVAVEFALIFPLVCLVLFALVQYGLYFFSMQAGEAAARDGARRASVGDMPTCTGAGDPFVPYVQDRVGSADFGNTTTVKRKYTKASGNTGAGVQPGDLVTVTVTFDSLNLNFPFVPVPGNATVSTVADTRVEFVPTTPSEC